MNACLRHRVFGIKSRVKAKSMPLGGTNTQGHQIAPGTKRIFYKSDVIIRDMYSAIFCRCATKTNIDYRFI